MEYAIVDIETTGGKPQFHDITEIAIVVTNGEEVVETYDTLVYTDKPIPPFVQGLTGITNEMLQSAPLFRDVADRVFQMLQGRVFVAHNVNFDFKFVNFHLQDCGYVLSNKKLCSVRLARKIIPGLPSYSLGRLCQSVNISVEGRHRAMGDAKATTHLFHKLLAEDSKDQIPYFLEKKQKEFSLPPNLSKQEYIDLPKAPGIYYMLDEKGRPLYIGKAKDIKKRVASHFSASFGKKNYQALYTRIHHLAFELTGNDLVASLLESYEIKRKQPPFNSAQRQAGKAYNIISYVDQAGWIRLAPEKSYRHPQAIATFSSKREVRNFLYSIAEQFNLCDKVLFLSAHEGACEGTLRGYCAGACVGNESAHHHNERMNEAIQTLSRSMEKMIILGPGRTKDEKSLVCCNNGQYLGFGFLDQQQPLETFDEAIDLITSYPADSDVQKIMQSFLTKRPNGYRIVQMNTQQPVANG